MVLVSVETKKDWSNKINGLLDLSPPLDFTRMSMKDLKRLYDTLSKIPSLIQVGARAGVERVMQGPAATAARDILNMPAARALRELRESGGVIGFLESRMRSRTRKESGETKRTD
jgi:hypothetical protein